MSKPAPVPVAPPSPVELVAWCAAQPQAGTAAGCAVLVAVAQAGALAAWTAATRVLRAANPAPRKEGEAMTPMDLGRAITEASRSAHHAAEAGLASVEAQLLLRDATAEGDRAAAALEAAASGGDAQVAVVAAKKARDTRLAVGPAAQRAVVAAVSAGATAVELAQVQAVLATYPGGIASIER